MRLGLAIVCVVALAACELQITNPAPVVAGPTPSPSGSTTITNTNTNTSTNNNDRSDTTAPTTPGTLPDGTGGSGLPAYGESVVRSVDAANPSLVVNSCQDTIGESAWAFLDKVVQTLRAQDPRWGYLCKDATCSTFGRDVITYRVDGGIWIVDIIGGHCPGPNDDPAEVRYGVLPFETVRKWAPTRTGGF